MGQTRFYDLAFFDFGDNLTTPINVQKEIDRFVVIDKQLYGMYRIFGNGVIDGFNVTDAGFQQDKGISIFVSEGVGIVNYIASQTEIPAMVNGLPPNSIVDIYATITGSTYIDRTVNFVYSIAALGENAIRLATVSTGNDKILFIDNNTRELIGFEQIIQDAINEHKHRGTPSKIDLETEVRNQLPGARLENIDASKITSGRFDIDRIPLIDHNDLENNGLLTHAALDSFIKTFSQNNRELLGEISSVNLLKSIIFWKTKFRDVDEFFINELALIPGVSPNTFIDFNASTANIDLSDSCISGFPAKTGIFTSVFWNDTFSFNTNTFKNNIVIQDDSVFVDRTSESVDSIADFEDGIMTFTPEMIISDSQQAAVVVDEGANYLGRLGGGITPSYYYRQNFLEGKNWDGTYDELVIKVKTSEQIHEPVYMYLLNGSNLNSDGVPGSLEVGDIDELDENGHKKKKPSSSWQLLAKDENMPEFEEKVFDISSLGLDNVTQITIYTTDDFVFDIDDIEVRRTNMLAESGTIRFRYSTEATVVFHAIFHDVETPSGTSAAIRVKIASSRDALMQAAWTMPLGSGNTVALSGSAVEIEVVMTSNIERTLTPILTNIELRLLTDADFTGFVIDEEDEWIRGDLSNASVVDSVEIGKSILNISSPINVGGRYFSKSGSVSEINDGNIGVYGFSGSEMPISPNQAREWSASSSRGFLVVSSVVRKFDNSFLIADQNNHRILQVDQTGNLIKGFGSTYSKDSSFYPLSAIYNSREQVFTLVFTKAAVVDDITKIVLSVGTLNVSLSDSDTILTNNKSGNKVLEILLDDDTAVRLLGATSENLTVNFEAGAFVEVISIPEGMSGVGNNSIFSPVEGLICFVGDFTYIDNIRHPVFVGETSDENWIIANSSVFYVDVDTNKEEDATVPDIIEIDPDNVGDSENKLISTDVKFSDYTLGGIYEYAIGRFVVAGIEGSSSALSGITGDELLDLYGGGNEAPEVIKFRAKGIDDLKSYAGRIFVLDKINNKKQVLYISPDGLYPSDIDRFNNGDFIVAESAVSSAAGRLVRIDGFGNVTWNYGAGTFSLISDTKVLNNDSLIVSV